MKQFTIVLDGIADRPQIKLNGKTPMEAAVTPCLDGLYKQSKPGVVMTIPSGLEVGSAVANMSLMGYNPAEVYRGRAVIEAAGADITVHPDNLYIRCNLVTLEGSSFDNSIMQSYSAHDIETEKARLLVDRLNNEVFRPPFKLINTDTFRNILVMEGAAQMAQQLNFMPAHDMIGGAVSDFIKGEGIIQDFYDLMRKAYAVLSRNNETAANGIWFWGASYAPSFDQQPEGRRVVLAETTLMRGIAALSGTDCITTEKDSDFAGFLNVKRKNAIEALKEYDYAYIHIQELDDLSHERLALEKTRAIECIDEYFIRPFFDNVKPPYSAVIVSDHYTFSDSGGHGAQPAPFMLIGHGAGNAQGRFTEQHCHDTGLCIKASELVAWQRGKK
ncbi:MAG: hypothetical protein ACOX8Q_01480 [Christensenellales bacterium]|jgi:2,3-bisphosphoglycerate-independent phosphoglycerate mutase